jgi:hypothetical protein
MPLTSIRSGLPLPHGECAECDYVGPAGSTGGCPKCGGAWKNIYVYGTGGIKVGALEARTRNPKEIDGKVLNVATLRAKTIEDIHDTTIQRTIDGESADLQIKFKVNQRGEVELLHVHCEKDKTTSEWKRGTGSLIEDFYDISSDGNGASIFRCKACGRKWSSIGRMEIPNEK